MCEANIGRTNHAPHTPTNLTSLPIEVLTNISSLCDRPTALSLARTSRYFTSCVESRLWRDIAVRLSGARLWQIAGWDNSGREDHAIHADAIKAKLSQILARGDERRWRMVETVALCVRPGSAHGMLYLLDCVSANLRELTLESGDNFDNWGRIDFETIDLSAFNARLLFPHLTHLQLGRKTLRSAQSILVLVSAAPSLTFLDVNIDNGLADNASLRNVMPYTPKIRGETLIQELRVTFGLMTPQCAYESIVTLLAYSPLITTLQLKNGGYADTSSSAVWLTILKIIGAYRHLTDLQIEMPAKVICFSADDARKYFPMLRRLVITQTRIKRSTDILKYIPSGGQLEVVIFDLSNAHGKPTPSITSPKFRACSPGTRGIIPSASVCIRDSPRLRVIANDPVSFDDDPHFVTDFVAGLDSLTLSNAFTGSVSSYDCAGLELLHVKLFLTFAEVFDEITDDADSDSSDESDEDSEDDEDEDPDAPMVVKYSMAYTVRRKVYERVPQAMWYDFTDLDGMTVPKEVIEQMRVAEGSTTDQWAQRGVKVGAEGIRVLQAWADSFPPEGSELD